MDFGLIWLIVFLGSLAVAFQVGGIISMIIAGIIWAVIFAIMHKTINRKPKK